MSSVSEIKRLMMDVVERLPLGPAAAAIQELETQIARLMSAAEDSSDSDLMSAAATLQQIKGMWEGSISGLRSAGDTVEQYAARL